MRLFVLFQILRPLERLLANLRIANKKCIRIFAKPSQRRASPHMRKRVIPQKAGRCDKIKKKNRKMPTSQLCAIIEEKVMGNNRLVGV
jgi:hypothetical protein